VVLVELDPAVGAEQGKVRPAVIVSNDGANLAAAANNHGVLAVVPLTSNTARVLDFQVLVPADDSSLGLDSKAQAEQVRAIDVSRVVRAVGRLPSERLAQLDDALRLHLSL
jgi:mRNA interferase MazF